MNSRVKILIGKNPRFTVQFFRYLIVAVIAMAVHFGFFTFFKWNQLLDSVWSNVAGNGMGIITNYILSVNWVFEKRRLNNRLSEFSIFALIGVIGMAIHITLLESVNSLQLAQHLGSLSSFEDSQLSKINDTFSFGVATGATFFWNFLVRKYSLFNKDGSIGSEGL